MLKKGLTKQILLLIVLICFTSTTANAARDWAPGISGKKISKSSKPKGSSNIWLRFGPSYGSFKLGDALEPDSGSYYNKDEYNITMVGVKLEFGIRVIEAEKDAKYRWNLELPIEISGYQRDFSIDDFMALGQFIPTGRLNFTTKSGMTVSPFLGYGGGVIIFLGGHSFIDTFHRVMTLRLGCDFMLKKTIGLSLGYNLSSIKSSIESYYNNYNSKDANIKFNQLTFSFIYHP